MPPPPPGTGKNRTGLTILIVTVCVALVLGAVSVLMQPSRGGIRPDHPETWDARVMFAVRFIEKERGKPFKHPVAVEFVPEAEYLAQMADTSELTDKDRKSAGDDAASLRALGLVEGNLDLVTEMGTLQGEGSAAYYRHDIDRVRVRGTELDLSAQGTIVHELTHAWQDQHYGLDRLGQESDVDSEAQLAFRMVVEGDASLMEHAWRETLSVADQKELEAIDERKGAKVPERIGGVPQILQVGFGAPYEFGPTFLRGLDAAAVSIDDVFADLPADEGDVLEPWTYLAADPLPPEAEAPALPAGAEEIDQDRFGNLFIYLMLADRIDPQAALAATDTVAGDAFRRYRQDGKVCVAATLTAAGDPAKLGDALRDWRQKLPGVTVTAAGGGGFEIRACDPGPDADLPVEPRSMTTIVLPILRVAIWTDALESGEADEDARCRAETFAGQLRLDDLEDLPIPPSRMATLQRAVTQACG